MRFNFYSFLLMTFFCVTLSAQSQEYFSKAMTHLSQTAEKSGLKSQDISGVIISSEARSEKYGTHYLYLNQTVHDIPVKNAVAVYVFDKNGNIASSNQTFFKDAASNISAINAKINPGDAILNAGHQLGLTLKSKPISAGRNDGGAQLFSFPEMTRSDITAELKYIPSGEKLVLAWNLNLDMKDNADVWDYYVDAVTGDFVYKYNQTLYCTHHKMAFSRGHNCDMVISDGADEIAEIRSENASSAITARYRVFALPVESPFHGVRTIATDDIYPQASPYGWHDTNGSPGAEFTYTRGNNVYAYQDKNNDNAPDGADTDGGTDLTFDFPLDMNLDPRESANATVTNLFYVSNMMHDISYLLGFTEEFGNYQQRNYTGAPGQGDPVLAEAFDGIEAANPSLNNANFSPMVDGVSGRMQMYLWNNNGGSVSVDSPEPIAGYIRPFGAAQFGRPIPSQSEPPITARVAIASDLANPSEGLGCGQFANADALSGKIVIVDRGICQFSQKVYNAQLAGAVGVIICNVPGINGGNGEEMIGMAGGTNANLVTIPSVFVGRSNCEKIRFSIRSGVEVLVTFQVRDREGAEFLDGSLDNGIIAHEYGHGISTRLTGGRTNSGCLNNDEQMGEGWSDFFSLITTHKPGDTGELSRGIGTFARGESPNGRGIRRYPYSTDLSINPQTFDDIKGTSGPHSLGEVWTASLWDLYWAFVNLYGFDPDWTNESSGNYKASFLVLEGMKIQPCRPGFIEGRDAILTADYLIHEGIHNCLIWEVFARRGVGFFADGGDTGNRNDGVQDFEPLPTCIESLKITKKATPLTEPGGEITVELRAINHIPERQSKVTIVDELPEGLSYVAGSSNVPASVEGNMLVFDLGEMNYEAQVNITYKARATTTNKSLTLYKDDFEGDITWDISVETGQDSWLPNYDFYRSPEASFGVYNLAVEMDASLLSPVLTVSGVNPALRFWHRYKTVLGFDGGFIQMSVNGGSYFSVSADRFLRNAPNSVIPYSTIAIPNLQGFTGNTDSEWIDSYIDLTDFKGQDVQFRFRFVSDAEQAPSGDDAGWFIDDVEILDLFKYITQACIFANDDDSDKVCTNAVQTIINSEGTVNTRDLADEKFDVRLMPNPAGEFVTVQITSSTSDRAVLSLNSLDGKVIYQTPVSTGRNASFYTIPLNGISSGLYLMKVQSGRDFTIRKLVVR